MSDNLITPQTLDSYPGLFYHAITNTETSEAMETVRLEYLHVAQLVLDTCPQDRYRSLALTALEESLMRAIQSLAVQDPSTKVVPEGL